MVTQPNEQSSDYKAMSDYWQTASDVMAGTKAMRLAGKRYLPQFPQETDTDYEFRRKNAKFTNVFRDIVENLAARPFEDELNIDDVSSDRITAFVEDVDGRGNHLHNFAKSFFLNGIVKSINWLLIDYTKDIAPNATIAEEKLKGARPFWVAIDPQSLIAVYSDIENGKEIITHARISENVLVREGFKETIKERIRLFNREKLEDGSFASATWQVYEKKKNANKTKEDWVVIEDGIITIGIIPLVPFWAGRRIGNTFQVSPPLQDALDLQVELYQQESGLKNIKESVAFPMLKIQNAEPPRDKDGKIASIVVGCKSVIWGNADFVEPQSQSLQFLASDVLVTKQDLRELGRQPLTAQTGNLTVITTAFAAAKGNAAITAWALNIKDCLENAFKITAMWFGENVEVEVKIKDDYDTNINDDKSPDYLIKMYELGVISIETLHEEMQRRGILSPDFESEEEIQSILNGGDNGEDESAILPNNSPNVDTDRAQNTDVLDET